MKVIPSFTAKYEYSKTPEERKYNILKDCYKGAESIGVGMAAFAVLETLDKFSLTKNKKNKPVTELTKLAKKHTKINALIGLGMSIAGYLIAWPWFKKCEPFNTKIYEWADKQNRIAEKAEQLVKEEDNKLKAEAKEPKKEIKEEEKKAE